MRIFLFPTRLWGGQEVGLSQGTWTICSLNFSGFSRRHAGCFST